MKNLSTYINLLTDFGFKHIFAREDHKKYLISFLNALFDGEFEIVDVNYVDRTIENDFEDERTLIYDLHCRTRDERKIIVEMQNRYQSYFDDRSVFYMCADIYRQARKGPWDYRLEPVYGIFLLNFEKGYEDKEHLRSDVVLMNRHTGKVFSSKFNMVFLRLPLLKKKAEDCDTLIEKWLYLIKNFEKMNTMPRNFMNDKIFRDLEHTASVATLSDKERRDYEASLKAYRDNYAILKTEREEGRAEGRAEGEAKGRSEEKRLIASCLKKQGLDWNIISSSTGLSIEDIERL